MVSAGENLPWIAPHFGAIASDLSAFHRIDDVDTIGMPKFVALLEHLHAYAGAYLASIQSRRAATAASAPQPGPVADGDTSDEEIQARWNAVLAQKFPGDYEQGVETMSAEEMVRLAGG